MLHIQPGEHTQLTVCSSCTQTLGRNHSKWRQAWPTTLWFSLVLSFLEGLFFISASDSIRVRVVVRRRLIPFTGKSPAFFFLVVFSSFVFSDVL